MTSFFNKKILWHILYWFVLLIYFMSVSWFHEKSKMLLFGSVFFKLILQIILAYLFIYLFIPYLLNRNRKIVFFISGLVSIYIAFITYSIFKNYILIPSFPEEFAHRPPYILSERFTYFTAFIGSIPGYIFPLVILVIFNYYKKQKEVSDFYKQKKSLELNALKNQLNPHFLFNTLNNLYTLALKKSDRTPEIISKLSEILDYVLYRCNNNFVSLKDEINLIKNYIALEEVRYGERVNVLIDEDLKNDIKIAPLLLLTFLENAYKHGVSEEIKLAKITLMIKADYDYISFYLENSKPAISKIEDPQKRDAIGLSNIRKQLDLLYSNNYKLDITETNDTYSVSLKIKLKDV